MAVGLLEVGVGATLTCGGDAVAGGVWGAGPALLSAKAATIPPPRRIGMTKSSHTAEPGFFPLPRALYARGGAGGAPYAPWGGPGQAEPPR